MDLTTKVVSLITESTVQKAEIAMIKAKQEADQQLINMVTEVIEDSKATISSDIKGQNVDKSL